MAPTASGEPSQGTALGLFAVERRPSPTAVTIYPTSIVDGKLENCASKVAQIPLSRRAELVPPVRQPALLHSRACLTRDWLLLAVRPGGIHCQLR